MVNFRSLLEAQIVASDGTLMPGLVPGECLFHRLARLSTASGYKFLARSQEYRYVTVNCMISCFQPAAVV